MRRILILMAILLALMFNPSAEAADPVAPGTSSPAISQHLDRLFAQLKLAASEQAGREIEQKIWIQWTTPDDPALADQMHQVLAARRVSDYDKALALLDAMVIAFPAYAEAWNQRATVHFLREDFEQSLADIAETLVHEPRHFGARACRALIR
ncbi:MAG: hypothetical protein HQ483_13300, partial [Rhodospirillales bacterium]|nr:hypothetical protein [Rhodospirillales bacterium]